MKAQAAAVFARIELGVVRYCDAAFGQEVLGAHAGDLWPDRWHDRECLVEQCLRGSNNIMAKQGRGVIAHVTDHGARDPAGYTRRARASSNSAE